MKKRNLISLMACLSSILLVGCVNKNPNNTTDDKQQIDNDDVQSISAVEANLNLQVGERKQINLVFTPVDCKNKKVTYTSSDENIAVVTSGGLVIAEAKGDATINVISNANEKAKATITVHVEDATQAFVQVESITANVSSTTMQELDAQKINVGFTPSDATYKEVKYSSSDETIVIVSSSGTINALKDGVAKITITSISNPEAKAELDITVTKRAESNPFVQVVGINVTPKTITKIEDEEQQLTVTLAGENSKTPSNQIVEYESSDSDIAMVDSKGLVKCLKAGEAVIHVKSNSNPNVKQDVNVTVSAKPVIVKDKVTSIQLTGLSQTYDVESEIDFTKAKLILTLNNDSTKTVELTHGEVDVTPETCQDSTEFIIHSNGLNRTGNLQEGEYNLSVEIISNEYDHKPLYNNVFTITISANLSSRYILTQFSEPANIVSYKQKLANAQSAPNNEGNFKQPQDCYTIGDDNEFIYKPTATLIKKSTKPELASVTLKLNAKVFSLSDDESTIGSTDVGNSIYTFNQITSGFKFSESAIGHKYQLQLTPTEFTHLNENEDEEVDALKLNIKVYDGYNAYTALDLGRMNLVTEQRSYLNWVVDTPNNRVQLVMNRDNATQHFDTFKDELEIKHFYDPNEQKKNSKTQYSPLVWKKYLEDVRHEQNLNEINGIFIQNDINITRTDIPEQYFISEAEALDRVNDPYSTGSLRDGTKLYSHLCDINDFTLNGNCFNLDFSNLPISLSNTSNKVPNYVYKNGDKNVYLSNTAAFLFINKIDNSSSNKAHFKNVYTTGNAIGSGTLNEKLAGSISFIKSSFGVTEIDNVISRGYNIGFFGNGEWFGNKTLEIRNSKLFDCFTSGAFIFSSNHNEIENTEMKRFGGPCIFLDSTETTTPDNDETAEGKDYGGKQKMHYIGEAGVHATSNCQFESMVTGNEDWFIINNAVPIATSIKQVFSVLNKYNATIEQDGRMNMIAIGLDKDALNSTNPTRVNFNYEGYPDFSTNTSETQVTTDQTLTGNKTTDDALPGLLYKGGSTNANDVNSTASEFRTQFPIAQNQKVPMVKACTKNSSSSTLGYIIPGVTIAGQTLSGLYTSDIPFSNGSITGLPTEYSGTLSGDLIQALIKNGSMEAALILDLYPMQTTGN